MFFQFLISPSKLIHNVLRKSKLPTYHRIMMTSVNKIVNAKEKYACAQKLYVGKYAIAKNSIRLNFGPNSIWLQSRNHLQYINAYIILMLSVGSSIWAKPRDWHLASFETERKTAGEITIIQKRKCPFPGFGPWRFGITYQSLFLLRNQ